MSNSTGPEERFARSLKRLFFASGATALVYETVFVKVFSLAFGTTAYAIATVLAAFMVGLALGSFVAGRLAPRLRHPLRVYAVLELAIGLFCAGIPLWHELTTRTYVRLYASIAPQGPAITGLQFALAILVMIAPAALMGSTLPAILRSGLRTHAGIGSQIGSFYTINLAGAAAGTFGATFLLLPWLGIYGTLTIAVTVNAAIFVQALRLGRGPGERPAAESASPAPPSLRPGVAAAIAAFSGFSSLAYENLFSHVLATIIGSSVYAFGTMLFTFLLGLALGSRLTQRWLRRDRGAAALAGALLLTPLFLAATVPLYDRVDALYGLVGLTAPSFLAMEACRFLICLGLLLIPATLLGMVFPLSLELSNTNLAVAPGRVGTMVALNTLASVAGSALTGFVLISSLGSERCFKLIGAAGVAVGLLVLFASPLTPRSRWIAGVTATGLFAALSFLLPGWDLSRLTGGRWVYFTHSHARERVIFFEEDVHGGMTTVTETDGVRTMWSNGKFQGNNATEMVVQRGFAVYPVLHARKFDRALNIGFGTGVTAGTLARFPFREIDVAEIAPAVLRASELFRPENRGVLSDPRVRVFVVDGRNHLLLHDRTYDLISIEISSVWISGAANLYNAEFYRLCRDRLEPGGILQQWVQLHHIDTLDLLLILNTARHVFPHCALYQVEHQGVLVASAEPLRIQAGSVRALDASAATHDLRRSLPMGSLLAYAGDLLLAPDEFDRALDAVVGRLGRLRDLYVSRDFLPWLEYGTPKGNAQRFALEANLGYLRRFGRTHLPSFAEPVEERFLAAILERRGDLGAALRRYEAARGDPEAEIRARELRLEIDRRNPSGP